jgi:8-oxo-dGTP pyrophosphatase MutT (NUDIX family)
VPEVPVALAAVSVLCRTENGSLEVFWARRAPSLSFLGGFWSFPGGRAEPGDASLEATAARELEEETGLVIEPTPGRYQLAGRTVTPAWASVRFDATYYLVEAPPGARPDVTRSGGELVESEWIEPTRALELWSTGERLTSPVVVAALEALVAGWDGAAARLRDAADAIAKTDLVRAWDLVPGLGMTMLRSPTIPPATHTNCFLVGNQEVIVVDPGSPYPEEQAALDQVLDRLEGEGRRIREIWITHHHIDHVAGVDHLVRRLRVPVAAHPLTAELLAGRVAVDRTIADGETVLFPAAGGRPERRLRAVFTPGHTPGHHGLPRGDHRLCPRRRHGGGHRHGGRRSRRGRHDRLPRVAGPAQGASAARAPAGARPGDLGPGAQARRVHPPPPVAREVASSRSWPVPARSPRASSPRGSTTTSRRPSTRWPSGHSWPTSPSSSPRGASSSTTAGTDCPSAETRRAARSLTKPKPARTTRPTTRTRHARAAHESDTRRSNFTSWPPPRTRYAPSGQTGTRASQRLWLVTNVPSGLRSRSPVTPRPKPKSVNSVGCRGTGSALHPVADEHLLGRLPHLGRLRHPHRLFHRLVRLRHALAAHQPAGPRQQGERIQVAGAGDEEPTEVGARQLGGALEESAGPKLIMSLEHHRGGGGQKLRPLVVGLARPPPPPRADPRAPGRVSRPPPPRATPPRRRRLRDRDVLRKIDVLDRLQQRRPLLDRPLERLAAADEAHAAGALVDDGGLHRLGQVALTLDSPPS